MFSIIFACFIACQSQESEGKTAPLPEVDLRPKVRIEAIVEKKFVRTLSLPATVYAQKSAILAPKVQGRIESVNVQIGDSVKKDDILMTMERNDYLAGFTEARAAYELAQIQANQAKKSAQRFADLLEKGAVTKSSS